MSKRNKSEKFVSPTEPCGELLRGVKLLLDNNLMYSAYTPQRVLRFCCYARRPTYGHYMTCAIYACVQFSQE
jgi:hypothetical protein